MMCARAMRAKKSEHDAIQCDLVISIDSDHGKLSYCICVHGELVHFSNEDYVWMASADSKKLMKKGCHGGINVGYLSYVRTYAWTPSSLDLKVISKLDSLRPGLEPFVCLCRANFLNNYSAKTNSFKF